MNHKRNAQRISALFLVVILGVITYLMILDKQENAKKNVAKSKSNTTFQEIPPPENSTTEINTTKNDSNHFESGGKVLYIGKLIYDSEKDKAFFDTISYQKTIAATLGIDEGKSVGEGKNFSHTIQQQVSGVIVPINIAKAWERIPDSSRNYIYVVYSIYAVAGELTNEWISIRTVSDYTINYTGDIPIEKFSKYTEEKYFKRKSLSTSPSTIGDTATNNNHKQVKNNK